MRQFPRSDQKLGDELDPHFEDAVDQSVALGLTRVLSHVRGRGERRAHEARTCIVSARPLRTATLNATADLVPILRLNNSVACCWRPAIPHVIANGREGVSVGSANGGTAVSANDSPSRCAAPCCRFTAGGSGTHGSLSGGCQGVPVRTVCPVPVVDRSR